MKISILIPHWKTGKMTAFTLSQIFKHSAGHELDVIVIDNNSGDGTTEYLEPFKDKITLIEYPKDRLQSQGIAFDYVMPIIKTEYFITLESDCYPEKDGWLDYYEDLINRGYDTAGSVLQLSGGQYVHPAGAMYRKSVWDECKKYCDSLKYTYFPNMSMKEGHQCHLMVHDAILKEFLIDPNDWIELSSSYKPYSDTRAMNMAADYKPATGPFHSGMGGRQESVMTYGQRTMATDSPFILLTDRNQKLINRLAYEPGQFFSYWMSAMGCKIFYIPTEIKWIDGNEGRQQEYTMNEAGVRHLWAISAYHNHTPQGEESVAKMKQSIPDLLYSTLPENQKI